MSVTLQEMDEALLTFVHQDYGGGGFDLKKRRYAIRAAGEEFLHKTQVTRTYATMTFSSGTTSVDPTASLTNFLPGCLVSPLWIGSGNEAMRPVAFENIRTYRDLGGTSGTPEVYSFLTPSRCEFFPEADEDYTVSFVYWQPLVSWSPIDTDSVVTLNIPDRYVYQIAATGAKWYLLNGLAGHPDAFYGREAFDALIERARGEVQALEPWFMDRASTLDNSYHRTDGYI